MAESDMVLADHNTGPILKSQTYGGNNENPIIGFL
jgi:hypothetical protein